MQKIVVASKNPVKLSAVMNGFERMFPDGKFEIIGISVPSGVGDQPRSDNETRTGALTRAHNASAAMPDADFWVGLEGGVHEKDGDMEAFAWIAVKSKNGQVGKGRTGVFYLPPQIAGLVRAGHELGHADDIVFARSNSKQENGAVGILTGNATDRTKYYAEAVVLALIPFKNGHLYNAI